MIRFFNELSKKISPTYSMFKCNARQFFQHMHRVCDESMESFAFEFSRFFEFFTHGGGKGARVYRMTLLAAYLSPIIFLLIFFSHSYILIVPVGDSAVVTRFGRYSRELESGWHFYIPIIEKSYLVNSMNLMEETFGFIQPYTPPPQMGLNAQDDFVQQYEQTVSQAESDTGAVFSERGHVFDALGMKQRLPGDYLKRTHFPPGEQAAAQAPSIETGYIPKEIFVPSELKVITGGLNMIHLTWVLQYRIKDSKNYLFNSRDVSFNIRDISQAMMSETIGDWAFTDVLGAQRDQIEAEAKKKIQFWFDLYEIGIEAFQVIILNALPTPEVVSAFNEVNKANQDSERIVYSAEMEYLNIIPEAKGEAKRIVADAQAYAIKILNEAEGQAIRFDRIVKEYEKNKQVTRDRLYIDAMEALFEQTPNTIVDESVKGILPIFGLNGSAVIQEALSPSLVPQTAPTSLASPIAPSLISTPQAQPAVL